MVLRHVASASPLMSTPPVHVLVDTEFGISHALNKHGHRSFVAQEAGRVSVVIASHDRFDWLMEAVESVRRQSYPDWEIIVVNDASQDPRYYELIEVRRLQIN